MINTPIKVKNRYGKEGVVGILFAMTPIIGFIIFGFIPLVLAVYMSAHRINFFSFEGAEFVGFDNFLRVFRSDRFLHTIRVTLINGLAMPISLVMALLVANFLNRNKFGSKIFRTIFFIPFVCSAVAVAMMWRQMFGLNFGVFNEVLVAMGFERVRWLTDPNIIPISMIIMGVWSGMAFGIILYSAALFNVPKTYYEAAKIDGAGSVRQFFSVTLPAISPTTFFLFTMGMIGMLQDFTRFFIMLGPEAGAGEAGLTVVFWLFNMGFSEEGFFYYGMGVAAALSIVLGIGIIIITRINFWLSKWWVHYD